MRKAVVLAAGRGKRMQSLSADRPKAMIPVAGRPMLEHILDRLAEAEFDDVLLVVGYQREQIEQHFGSRVQYRVQDPIDGTGSAVLLARDFVETNPFLLTFGDILMDSSEYAGIWRRLFEDPEAEGCVGVKWVEDPHRGAAVYEESGVVRRIIEKPPPGSSTTHWNSAGLYAFRPAVFEELARIPRSPRGEYELTSAVSQMLEHSGRLLLHPIVSDWGDIGRPEDLALAEQVIRKTE